MSVKPHNGKSQKFSFDDLRKFPPAYISSISSTSTGIFMNLLFEDLKVKAMAKSSLAHKLSVEFSLIHRKIRD